MIMKLKCKGVRKMYVAAFAALSFATAAGMVCGYSASATSSMKRVASPVHPDQNQVAWIGSIMALGAAAGGIAAGYLSDRFGRKGTLLINSLPLVVGWLFITYADVLVYIYIGRVITGVCIGIIFGVVPPYLVEISTTDVRGLFGSSFQLFVVFGSLLVNAFGTVLAWKWLTVPSEMFVLLALFCIVLVPESPRWLISQGAIDEAISAVKFLQGNTVDASAECAAINEDIRLQPKGNLSWKELMRPEIAIPGLLSFFLVFFQQSTGSNAVLFYTTDIFKAAGSSIPPELATVIINVVLVVATFISSAIIDKTGRKLLLIISGIGMLVSLLILGTYDYLASSNAAIRNEYGWIPLPCLVAYIGTFSLGFGPIPWLMMAEMSTSRTRSLICGTATALCWFFVFVVTKTFQTLEFSIQDYGAYYLYAAFSFLSVLFTIFCLPETKGKQAHEIELYFSNLFKKNTSIVKYQEFT